MHRRYTILLLIPHLGGGGAQRVIALLAHCLPSNRFIVHLGVVTGKDGVGETFPSHVHLHALGASRVRFAIVSLVCLVRKIKPDLILSGMFHLNFMVLLLRPFFPSSTRIFVRQNGVLSAKSRQTPRLERILYSLTYPHADGIIGQTNAMADELKERLGRKARIHVLRNPVDVETTREVAENARSRWTGSGPHLLAVGRLAAEKGFDLLLDAFARVLVSHPGADLTILGNGPERRFSRTEVFLS